MMWQRNSQPFTANMKAALAGFALVTLLAVFTQAAWQQTDFSCTVLKLALGTLSYLGVAVWQVIHDYPCVQWIFDPLQHFWGALGPLFAHLAPTL